MEQSFASRMFKERPFNFWQWERLGTYLEFLAGFIVFMVIVHFALGWSSSVVERYVDIIRIRRPGERKC